MYKEARTRHADAPRSRARSTKAKREREREEQTSLGHVEEIDFSCLLGLGDVRGAIGILCVVGIAVRSAQCSEQGGGKKQVTQQKRAQS